MNENDSHQFLADHRELTRRYFLAAAGAGLLANRVAAESSAEAADSPRLADAIAKLESLMTPQDKFRDVSRGEPLPHALPLERKQQVGLTRESWKLEVIADFEHPARIRKPLKVANGSALDFAALMRLAERHAVRFAKVMTCLNIGCPLGMGVWEGVPLRELLWLTEPRENLRRVFYYGYHNDDPKQIFKSSLPVDRVLEDQFGLPPVIVCYKLNGQWLSSERGGPVRVVVPEAYGFKSIKWLTHIVLSNLYHANDTYADGNNDVDSSLKTFAATIMAPTRIEPAVPIPITGYVQVGISGLSKVQVWVQSKSEMPPSDDRYYSKAPWRDARILPPPDRWGGELIAGRIPPNTHGFDTASGRPRNWPMRLTRAHWVYLHPGLPPGEYTLRCRSIDAANFAQPMPRPFRKSGHCAIEEVSFIVAT